ncbi:MAG: molybdopterin-synthase adenylyltransferase MoeB [Chlamydiae bacterium]|nr:molybdopterin-synthase adenylyltransferase MoeB [Chlamydiota bacterium]MBI3267336.1 molybdopterin-synthase adenylyltransferase MoeB [Chlamydiota bacterium]
MPLSKDQIARYSRHLIMPEVGIEGQEKLCNARVLCIGAGGLGSPLALYLAAAGVGHLGIVDFDVVDFSNLQRQIIHSEAKIGESKAESAKERLLSLNSSIDVEIYKERLSSDNAIQWIEPYDIVVDGTDNFATRYLVNDACVLLKKPNVYGSIFRFEGQSSVFAAERGPCYRCLYPEPPPPGMVPSCAEGGVLGILPGLVGCIQATETIKLILGQGEPLIGRLLIISALEMKIRELKLRKDPNCPICSDHPTLTSLIDYEEFCGIGRGQEETQKEASDLEITARELKKTLDSKKKVVVVDVREPHEYDICHLEESVLIPLADLPQRVNELDTADEIVTHCHHGVRSLNAAKFLKEMGFKKVKSLKGGIHAWATDIDPNMATY